MMTEFVEREVQRVVRVDDSEGGENSATEKEKHGMRQSEITDFFTIP